MAYDLTSDDPHFSSDDHLNDPLTSHSDNHMQPRQIKVGGGGGFPASRASSGGSRYPARRSTRLQGVKLEDGALCELSDDDEDGSKRRTYGGLVDLMGGVVCGGSSEHTKALSAITSFTHDAFMH